MSDNISNDYTITNYSSSLENYKTRDPANDTTAASASCTYVMVATNGTQFDGKTVILEDTNGLQKTYIFDNDGDGATGTVDGSGRIIVQFTGSNDSPAAGRLLRDAIHSANGHSGSLIVTQGEFDDRFLITQRDSGASGNTNVGGTTASESLITYGGGLNVFSDGVSDFTAYKSADVIPYKLSVNGIFNSREQTTASRYRVFLGEEKS